MNSQSFPDWSKVGRRLGKKLRDILNPPKDRGPSQEEKEAQRRKDLLKGFVYFDTWEEIFSWAPTEVDQTQIANVSLCPRYKTHIHGSYESKTRLLLCHDYDGGYHDYESNRPSLLKSQMYFCEHLQYVDTFIYFSHKLVCIPPASWSNLLHRNGVKVFGTYILEPQIPQPDRMFETERGVSRLASVLAMMAQRYNFDGWLINIEREFSISTPGVAEHLQRFLIDLKRCVAPKEVIWYDAITVDNEIEYQNGLTKANAVFAKSADAIFTNYKWGMQDLQNSGKYALAHKMQENDVHFGIDVWAQNTNMPGPPRITFPRVGGGGTNTGYAMGVLADNHFSSAVFGLAWSFQHFPTGKQRILGVRGRESSIAEAVNNTLWLGDDLPEYLHCDCKKGKPHHTELYKSNPIVAFAREYPAGAPGFLFTDFTQPFSMNGDGFDSRLGSQAIMPCPQSSSEMMDWEHKSKGLNIVAKTSVESTRPPRAPFLPSQRPSQSHLCLYNVFMPLGKAIDGELRCERTRAFSEVDLSLYLGFVVSGCPRVHYEYFAIPVGESAPLHFSQPGKHDGFQLVEVGISCSGEADLEPLSSLLEITSLLISKHDTNHKTDITHFQITGIHITTKEICSEAEKRLAWSWAGDRAEWSEQLPWSETTGPFSHFDIYSSDTHIGRAHSCELPLREGEPSRDGRSVISIIGTSFAGESVSTRIELTTGIVEESGSDTEGDWVVINHPEPGPDTDV